MSGTTTGGGPPHNPINDPIPSKTSKQKLLELVQSCDADLRTELVEYLAKLFAERTGDD